MKLAVKKIFISYLVIFIVNNKSKIILRRNYCNKATFNGRFKSFKGSV
jgi:hypothetical protein